MRRGVWWNGKTSVHRPTVGVDKLMAHEVEHLLLLMVRIELEDVRNEVYKEDKNQNHGVVISMWVRKLFGHTMMMHRLLSNER